jgi:hypothetical protein
MLSSLISPNNSAVALQRNGVFELYVGKANDVQAHLAEHKPTKDPYGQLSLNANVVESSNNLSYIIPDSNVGRTIYKYVDTPKSTRNGVFGQDASFVYPLKPPSPLNATTAPTNTDVRLGIYADGEDLKNFLTYVGVDEWSKLVKDSPDKITQYAIEFAEDAQTDSSGTPIVAKEVSTFPNTAPLQTNRLNVMA